jgi:hypothetical protein
MIDFLPLQSWHFTCNKIHKMRAEMLGKSEMLMTRGDWTAGPTYHAWQVVDNCGSLHNLIEMLSESMSDLTQHSACLGSAPKIVGLQILCDSSDWHIQMELGCKFTATQSHGNVDRPRNIVSARYWILWIQPPLGGSSVGVTYHIHSIRPFLAILYPYTTTLSIHACMFSMTIYALVDGRSKPWKYVDAAAQSGIMHSVGFPHTSCICSLQRCDQVGDRTQHVQSEDHKEVGH